MVIFLHTVSQTYCSIDDCLPSLKFALGQTCQYDVTVVNFVRMNDVARADRADLVRERRMLWICLSAAKRVMDTLDKQKFVPQ